MRLALIADIHANAVAWVTVRRAFAFDNVLSQLTLREPKGVRIT